MSNPWGMTRLLAVAVALLLAAPAVPQAGAAEPVYSTAYFPSADGTKLHAEVFRPAGSGRFPVVLLVSPYNNGTSVTVDDRQPGALHYAPFKTLLAKGYAIVQASLRGYSASGGCGDWGGKGEQADAKAAVEWAASQSWSTGRVGMYGISYDGWTQIMALASKPKGLAAVVAQAPLTDGYRAFWMNGSHYQGGWWQTASVGYGTTDLKPSNTAQGPEGYANSLSGTALNPHCYASNAAFTALGDKSLPYWQERDIVAKAAESTVPVLWSQGFRDIQVKPDNFAVLYPRLRGPKRVWVGQFTHRAPNHPLADGVLARYVTEAIEWFDAHVKRDPAARRRAAARPQAVVQEGDGRWRTDSAWPPRDARASTFALRAGTYYEDPRDDGTNPTDPGDVLWSVSQRLPYAVHLAGVPRVTLTAQGSGPAQVVVKVYDVDPAGRAVMVTRAVHANVEGKVAFDLYPQDWRFRAGHRIAVAVQGSEAFWSWPRPHWPPDVAPFRPALGGDVAVSGASLTFPALRADRRTFLFPLGLETEPELTLSAETIRANAATFRLPPRAAGR